MKTNSRKNIIIIVLTLAIIMIIGILFSSYGFVSSRVVDNKLSKNKTYINQKLSLNFSDGSEQLISNNESFIPGSTIVKKFTIKNTGNVLINYSINLTDIANTFVRESDIEYELKVGDKVVDSNIFPKEDSFLLSKETLNVDEEREYVLTIKYLESEENQIVDQGKTISGKITIDEHFKSIKTLKIYGNSVQEGTPSVDNPIEIKSLARQKNLFNAEKIVEDSGYPNNIYITDDGEWLRVEDSSKTLKIYADFKENTQYTVTFTVKGNGTKESAAVFRAVYTDGTSIPIISQYVKSTDEVVLSGTTSKDKTIDCIISGNHNGSYHFVKLSDARIEEGTSTTEYSSSRYTVPLTFRGKNMYNPGYELPKVINGITIDYEKDTGLITLNGSGTNNWKDINNFITIKLEANKIYTHSVKAVEGTVKESSAGVASILLDKLSNQISFNGWMTNNNRYKSVIIDNRSEIMIRQLRLWPYDDGSWNELTNLKLQIMLAEGTENVEFEPYTEKLFNIYLNEPLRSVGDCDNCSDYIDINNNKIVRNVGVIESYNGETIDTNYVSSTGGLDTGAYVIYKLATPIEEEYDFRKVLKLYDRERTYLDVCISGICASNVEVEYYE